MKKSVSSNKKTVRSRKRKGSVQPSDPAKILRTVAEQEAFYFYETIGKPTGENAKSLADFLARLEYVSLESLNFHLQRKDFPNWVEKTLGDTDLAKELGDISSLNDQETRRKICQLVENRIRDLKNRSTAVLVDEASIVLVAKS